MTGLRAPPLLLPIVSGIAALMLEANPNLGYRDVQEILAYSSRNPTSSDWASNAAKNSSGGGLTYADEFGFGLVDAHAAVRLAESWTDQSTLANLTVSSGKSSPSAAISDGVSSLSDTITISGSDLLIDHVEVDVSLEHEFIGDLMIEITSPGGTRSMLMDRPMDGSLAGTGSLDFAFDSVQFWGENALGDWTITVTDTETGDTGKLKDWTLNLYGDAYSDDTDYIFTDEWNSLGTDAARNTINDAAGSDTFNFAAMTTTVNLDMNASAVSTVGDLPMVISSTTTIERAIGGDAADVFSGNAQANVLYGMRGDDNLSGQAGDDLITGGAGNDLIAGGYGTDTAFYSGQKSNYAVLTDAEGTTIVYDKTGVDGIDELTGIEKLVFSDQEVVIGSVTEVSGTSSTDSNLEGTLGSDIIEGLAGNDVVSGLTGDDYIIGGAGDDRIKGGTDEDGLDNDTAVFSGFFDQYTITTNDDGTVTVADGQGGRDGTDTLSGIETIEFADARVTVGSEKPITVGDTLAVDEGATKQFDISDLLANDFDFQQDAATLSITSITDAKFGVVTPVVVDGKVTKIIYSPNANNPDFNGLDSFTYTVTDSSSNTSTAAVSINVAAVNDAPVAATTQILGFEGAVASGRLRATDIDGDILTYSLAENGAPAKGILSISANGTYTYNPNNQIDLAAGTTETLTFTYQVSDGSQTVTKTADLVVSGCHRK